MNLLALDTSTDIMSIALQRGTDAGVALFQHSATGGAQTSTHLIPEILRLMALAQLRFADLDAIVFGAGPGSFTGLRTACSVAQGLGFGAAIPLLPVDTLMTVAEEARWQTGAAETFAATVLLDARMDELYTADYVFEHDGWTPCTSVRLIKPEQLVWNGTSVLAGNVFDSYGARLPALATRISALPMATALLRLAPTLLGAGAAVPAEQAMPSYIRDKVAQTTQERAAIKAQAGVAP
ncbi:tRNA (adenosine(37)-N6)-threonylcarbamoyltransferase complex dimerization subunit type 1 TsaB [Rhodoferax sp.]|uniref:tRNA (adenosine(37)-N6)-threonylcarbamoyltransferase complex dimerization subunit type 1 TsaB n=1 Tax=Rhodoferax sp. TaxID=50421 RepID=UPI002605E6E1|nr:tRNA (adenosine(37)-N6)-threonylcarbamoyltransferase complex dimerization subunit type 1 TsaB [Rhodoferax sp.]MDD2918940.1 tRNA (adenosine(37)-N6)-threonylcarbamoyltransferase complex dimerization subunit type 1 TsaB [Rhodoferax sp.]